MLNFSTKFLLSHYSGIISEVPCIFFVMMCIVWALSNESAMRKKQIEPPSIWLKYVVEILLFFNINVVINFPVPGKLFSVTIVFIQKGFIQQFVQMKQFH